MMRDTYDNGHGCHDHTIYIYICIYIYIYHIHIYIYDFNNKSGATGPIYRNMCSATYLCLSVLSCLVNMCQMLLDLRVFIYLNDLLIFVKFWF